MTNPDSAMELARKIAPCFAHYWKVEYVEQAERLIHEHDAAKDREIAYEKEMRAIEHKYIAKVSAERDRLAAELAEAKAGEDQAYAERAHLVAALACLFPSGIRRTSIEGWKPAWHGCVYIDLPSGQISYHYHDSQAHLFEMFPPYEKPYDNHDKQIVHHRLAELAQLKTGDAELEEIGWNLRDALDERNITGTNEKTLILTALRKAHARGREILIGRLAEVAKKNKDMQLPKWLWDEVEALTPTPKGTADEQDKAE